MLVRNIMVNKQSEQDSIKHRVTHPKIKMYFKQTLLIVQITHQKWSSFQIIS